jgi:LuxR family maltose regulon positive regulatory protein
LSDLLAEERASLPQVIPTIENNTLHYQQNGQDQQITVGTPDWYAWLAAATTFRFHNGHGTFTAHRERASNRRGGWYWKAYYSQDGKRHRIYLGKAEDLTPDHLNAVMQTTPMTTSSTVAPTTLPATVRAPANLLLDTKLHVPRLRASLVQRTHLIERLQQGMEGSLLLISAPAGFGKTTLLAQWLAESGIHAAWLSLSPEDNDPVHFLSYIIAALQTLDSTLGTSALTLLHASVSAPLEAILAILTNDLASHARGRITLVLDDYQVLTAEPIHRALAYLVEHAPSQLRLVIATRSDPPLPLARLRARGQLTELRATELRFAPAEANVFLHEVMGLDLSTEAVTTLDDRTEGWIAGLQLAALSLRGRTDVAEFLAAFTGSHRFVLDYLSEEVFAQQPASVQSFLLHTCILERMTGPLCNTLMEQGDGQTTLEAIDKANLFLVSLDDERRWYRYHHLFAQVLRARLQQTTPTVILELHRRASRWYEQNGFILEAVQHALSATDFERVAALIEPIGLIMVIQGQVQTILGWLNALPEPVIHDRPLLSIYYASALLLANNIDACSVCLQKIEQSLPIDRSSVQVRRVLGMAAILRAILALYIGDGSRSIALAQQALDLLPETEQILRLSARVHTIRAHFLSGDVRQASIDWVAEVVTSVCRSGDFLNALGSILMLARLQMMQGRLRLAAATCAKATQLTPEQQVFEGIAGNAVYYFILGEIRYEQNDLVESERLITQGMRLTRETLLIDARSLVLGYTTLARLQQILGKHGQALETLDAFITLAREHHFVTWLIDRAAALRAQIELAQGNLAAATRWAQESGLTTDDQDLPYLREREYVALLRVSIAQGRKDPESALLQGTLQLLDRLQQEAESLARMSSILEFLILRALLLDVLGEQQQAIPILEQAVTLAEPEGYVRPFADEGKAMGRLLTQLQARGHSAQRYLQTLLAACRPVDQASAELTLPPKKGSPRLTQPLIDPLSERELEVLHLLAEGASNAAIAEQLVIATSTVKRHMSNIFAKLAVNNRVQAVARARELAIL